MDVYIPLSLYVIAVSIFFRKNKKILFLMVFVPLLLFWGTRVDFGVDYSSYKEKFEYQHEWDIMTYLISVLNGKFEPGYFLLMKIAPDFNSLVFICALIYTIGIVFFFYELLPAKYCTLALLLFLFFPLSYQAVQTIRSSLTLSLFLMACVAKMKGNMKTAYVFALISATFHMSGLLLLLLLLPKNETLAKRHDTLTFFICFFILIALLIPNFWPSILKRFVGKIENLSDAYESYIYERSLGIGFYLFSLMRVGCILYILSLLKRKALSGNFIWIAWLSIIYYILQIIQNVEIAYRFCTYFYFITIILKCYVLKVDKTKASRIFVGISIIYVLFNFYNVILNPLNGPENQNYHSFLF